MHDPRDGAPTPARLPEGELQRREDELKTIITNMARTVMTEKGLTQTAIAQRAGWTGISKLSASLRTGEGWTVEKISALCSVADVDPIDALARARDQYRADQDRRREEILRRAQRERRLGDIQELVDVLDPNETKALRDALERRRGTA